MDIRAVDGEHDYDFNNVPKILHDHEDQGDNTDRRDTHGLIEHLEDESWDVSKQVEGEWGKE